MPDFYHIYRILPAPDGWPENLPGLGEIGIFLFAEGTCSLQSSGSQFTSEQIFVRSHRTLSPVVLTSRATWRLRVQYASPPRKSRRATQFVLGSGTYQRPEWLVPFGSTSILSIPFRLPENVEWGIPNDAVLMTEEGKWVLLRLEMPVSSVIILPFQSEESIQWIYFSKTSEPKKNSFH